MNTTPGSRVDTQQDELDTLLTLAPRYAPPAGFADRVLAALHEEEAAATAPSPYRPWYLRPYGWGSAAAACITTAFCLFSLQESTPSLAAEAQAVDDILLVDEVLDTIDDPNLISAICSVSTGAYSISTGSWAR